MCLTQRKNGFSVDFYSEGGCDKHNSSEKVCGKLLTDCPSNCKVSHLNRQ